ncbi:MAG: transcription/translation regulatory transformer protein RfaH [Gammaproteobacteria bacterium]|nr:MAG: transcription/translation regulatory transformer protein RfaH [Gammaproteobacteria bacterium]
MQTPPDTSSYKHWYLIHSKPREEEVARTNLERQGYTVYLPLCKLLRRRLGRRIHAVGPLFPRYLFIRLESGIDDWRPIRSTKGVATLVRFGMEPARVPRTLIETLMARADPAGVHVLPGKEFKPGAPVRIMEGVMHDYDAIFLARSAHDRVILLLDIIGKQVRIEVEAAHIEAR